MADNSKLLLLGGAVVAYYAYTQGWLASFGLGTPATPAPAPAVPATLPEVSPVPPTTAASVAPTVSDLQAAVILAAQAPADGLGVDAWGWYLNNQLAPLGKAAPDPMPLFTAATPGFERSQKVTAAQYWAVMAPALHSQLGLSGLGMYRWVN